MSKFPPLYNSPTNVVEIPNLFSREEIQQLADIIKPLPLDKGNVLSDDQQQKRSSRVKWIHEVDPNLWIYRKLQQCIHEVNSTTFQFNLKGWSDQIQYTEYSEEYEGKYDWHLDNNSGEYSHRKLSISVQLSEKDSYEGGDFEIFPSTPEFGITYTKSIGNAIIFPSFLAHRISPVTKGIRRSLVWWVGGCPFR